MYLKIEYTDQSDRQSKLEANNEKFLVEEQNLLDGNFLIFSTEKPLGMQIAEANQNTLILKDEVASLREVIETRFG